jgi:hypothetical protein
MTETPELSYNAKYYNAKIKSNPEFYEKERKRVCEYIHNRYNNDEEYKQKILQQKKDYYQRKKLEKLEREKIENPEKYLERLKREQRRLKASKVNIS